MDKQVARNIANYNSIYLHTYKEYLSYKLFILSLLAMQYSGFCRNYNNGVCGQILY